MNKLTNLRKFVFASIITLFGVISSVNAQSLTGSGTENDPYLITSAADWNTFAEAVTGGNSYSGKYIQLTNDIPTAADIAAGTTAVSTMAGLWDKNTPANRKPFSGTFDGNWHTLTFNKGTEAVDGQFNEDYCAPFRYINGATIKNLTVQGTIISKKKFVGGFVGSATGKCYITNCTSSIHILCNYIVSSDGDCTHGGFVGREENKADDIVFDNCLFDGWIKDTKDTKTATKCAGFVGWAEGKVHYTSCYMVGEIVLKEKAPRGNFHRNGTIAYYLYDYYNIRYLIDSHEKDDKKHGPVGFGLTQTLSGFSKKYVAGGKNYYLPCITISGLDYIEYDPANPAMTPEVYFFSKKLVEGADNDYTVDIKMKDSAGNYTIKKTKIQDAGDYKVTISGTNSVYFGSDAVYFSILTVGQRWSDLQAQIDVAANNSTIELIRDYVATSKDANALTINKNITIDLKGHTINRNLSEAQENGRVIEIASGFNVTIKDGTITGGYKVAKDDTNDDYYNNDCGGIYNLGHLTLKNVTVTGNRILKKNSADGSYTGRGGGIYCGGDNSSFNMEGGAISGNAADGGGGGIFINQTTICNMSDVTVSSNITKDKGAGMRLTIPASKTYNIENCSFRSNNATDKANSEGGAIYIKGNNSTSSKLYLNACVFEYNSAFSKGGAIFSYSGTTDAKNCTMNDNLTFDEIGVVGDVSKGGSLYLQNSGSTYTMDGGSINGSGALTNGGAVFVENGATFNVKGNVKIKECSVYDEETNIDNNVYLDGSTNVIHVVGPLGPNALICVTYNGEATNVISDPSGYASIANFQLDNTHQRLNVDGSGNYSVYTANLWDDAAHWPAGSSMDGSGNCIIAHEIIIPSGVKAEPKSITLNSGGSIVIEDGGQLVYNTSVPVKVQHDVNGAASDNSGWYTISSAVCENDHDYELLSNISYMLNAPYDMFYYDEAASYWRNQKDDVNHFDNMERGRGYIYRNGNKVRHSYDGYTNVGDIYYNLSCAATNDLKGFNLVGNPYTKNITILNTTLVDNSNAQIEDGEHNPINLTGFYRLSNSGEWGAEITSTSEPIAVNEGFLIQIPEAAKKIKFSQTPREAKRDNLNTIMLTVENSEYSDVAYALFEKGLGLTKISHRNPEAPMVYIKQNNKDYAIAILNDDVKAFDLCFEAKTTGRYTMTINPEGEFSYLHLIDKLSGEDIDMLQDNEYSFIGSPADEADRFIVRLEYSESSDNSVFAYQSGNEIVVSGEGELQVFDVMGRLVMQKHVSGVESIATPMTTGVYILRLNDKTQKIIIK